jgi:integrase/recombinase XerD
MNSKALDPVIEGYLDYLKDVSRKAPRTVIDVRCTLKQVATEMGQFHPQLPLWKLRLEDYIQWMDQQRSAGKSGRSLCKSLSHVRGLLDYAWRSGRSDRNVLDGFALQDQKHRIVPDFLSEAEARKLVESLPAGTPAERRDRMIILLLYGCGLRTDELCRLDNGDVNRERRELTIWRGKGDRQRIVPIPQGVFTELLAYLLERGGKRGPLLRTFAKRARISAKVLCEVVRKAAERAEIAKLVTPKTLRHSYATHLMDRGVDLAIISSLMGHRSPAETGVYLHVLEGRPRQAVDSLGGQKGAAQS